MKIEKRIRFGRGRLAALFLLACMPLLTGCAQTAAWAFMFDWGALILFAPLRSLFGDLSLQLVNNL
jgi:hypothetical protein